MNQKYLYLVDHFIPAPFSDGGLWNVVAEDDNECFELIATEDNELNLNHYPKLKENILKAQRFALQDDYESGILEAFTT
jgi:hypothetical protein